MEQFAQSGVHSIRGDTDAVIKTPGLYGKK